MKILMFHVREFWYATHRSNLDGVEEAAIEGELPDGGLLAWIQVESVDEGRVDEVVRKAIKNIKWLARKVETRAVMLHSFAHLSEDRGDPDVAREILERVRGRLASVDFDVSETAWGHFNEFRMHVEGPGYAKVFKSI